jgi:hypothetical protein
MTTWGLILHVKLCFSRALSRVHCWTAGYNDNGVMCLLRSLSRRLLIAADRLQTTACFKKMLVFWRPYSFSQLHGVYHLHQYHLPAAQDPHQSQLTGNYPMRRLQKTLQKNRHRGLLLGKRMHFLLPGPPPSDNSKLGLSHVEPA